MQRKPYKNFTDQTRLRISADTCNNLKSMASQLSQIERKLLADYFYKKIPINDLKRDYIKNFKITARQFNSCRIVLTGKVKSYFEKVKEQIALLKIKIPQLEKHIHRLKNKFKIHQKKRRLNILKNRLRKLEKDYKNKLPRICFGSKKLFNKQFNLEKNSLTRDEWLNLWKNKRNDSFYLIGSKDESCGNQSCQFKQTGDSFSLELRLPNCFENKTIKIENIKIAHGFNEISKALEENFLRKKIQKEGKDYKNFGKAVNVRFKFDEKGCRLFITVEKDGLNQVSRKEYGTIGLDINANHIALVETDRFGNVINKKNIKNCTYGKTKNQSLAIIGDNAKEIVEYAYKAKKPIVLENLSFVKKKHDLREKNKKYSRMLSSFSYKAIINHIESKAFDMGIEIYKVNPAYTSIIGRVKFASRYGLTHHQAAALVIARRVNNYSERLGCLEIKNKNSKPAFFLPVRNRKKHIWSLYKELIKMLKTAGELQLSTVIRSIKKQSILCDSNSVFYRRDSGMLIVGKTA